MSDMDKETKDKIDLDAKAFLDSLKAPSVTGGIIIPSGMQMPKKEKEVFPEMVAVDIVHAAPLDSSAITIDDIVADVAYTIKPLIGMNYTQELRNRLCTAVQYSLLRYEDEGVLSKLAVHDTGFLFGDILIAEMTCRNDYRVMYVSAEDDTIKITTTATQVHDGVDLAEGKDESITPCIQPLVYQHCPFCDSDQISLMEYEHGGFYMECMTCMASGPWKKAEQKLSCETLTAVEAVERWNKRIVNKAV